MKFTDMSPLRYPGGKTKMFDMMKDIITHNRVTHYTYVEPYAGGFGLGLMLFFNNVVRRLIINDFDRSVYAFWYAILNDTERFVKKILDVEVNLEEWDKQKMIQNQKQTADLFDLGFSTFFLNRTNRSGVINGGVIGGRDQTGKYKIDCRFNKIELIRRITTIAAKRDQIQLHNQDAIKFMKELDCTKKYFIYLDPPYYNKGPNLYLNHYKHAQHAELSQYLQQTDHRFVVSYDDTPEIRQLYDGMRYLTYSLNHQVANKGKGKEIMYFSKNVRIKREWNNYRE